MHKIKIDFTFSTWENLPDLDLYMDQLLIFINRQIPQQCVQLELSKSMVNNYIKQELIPRPNGKRYAREHIAKLTMVTVLKEVLTIQDCKLLFELLEKRLDIEAIYKKFLAFYQLIVQSDTVAIESKLNADKQNIDEMTLYYCLISFYSKIKGLGCLRYYTEK